MGRHLRCCGGGGLGLLPGLRSLGLLPLRCSRGRSSSRSSKGRGHGSGGSRETSDSRRTDLFVDVFVSCHVVGSFVLTFRRAELQLDLERDVVQLSRIGNLQDANGMADRGQLLVADFLSSCIRIAKVQAGVDLFALEVLRSDHVELALEVSTGVVFGRLHFGSFHNNIIPASRQSILCAGIRCDLRCVKVKNCGHKIPL